MFLKLYDNIRNTPGSTETTTAIVWHVQLDVLLFLSLRWLLNSYAWPPPVSSPHCKILKEPCINEYHKPRHWLHLPIGHAKCNLNSVVRSSLFSRDLNRAHLRKFLVAILSHEAPGRRPPGDYAECHHQWWQGHRQANNKHVHQRAVQATGCFKKVWKVWNFIKYS